MGMNKTQKRAAVKAWKKETFATLPGRPSWWRITTSKLIETHMGRIHVMVARRELMVSVSVHNWTTGRELSSIHGESKLALRSALSIMKLARLARLIKRA